MDNENLNLNELVHEHLTPLRAFLASMGVHPDLIDDVAQDVFVQVLNNLERYDPERSFRAWLFGIAKNIVYQEYRKRARDRRLREDLTSQTLIELHTADEIRPDNASIKKENLSALRHCISRLPDNSRRLISLKFQHNYKSYELAEIVGMQAAAVRMSLMRIRKFLRHCVQSTLAGGTA